MMKSIKYILGLSVVVILFNGCTDNFVDLNTPPDRMTLDGLSAPEVGQAFARSQYQAVTVGGYEVSNNLYADMWSQYFALTYQNFPSDRNVEVGLWSNIAWNGFYNNTARAIKFVDDFTAENNMPVENAINKVWKVQAYHRITDFWGPIIYSDFGNGETRVGYDTQESIYKDFFSTLDAAVEVLKQHQGGNTFSAHDQIYQGDVGKWLTFANSLRLRLALRVKYVEPQLAQAEAEKAVADGVMTANDDNAMVSTTFDSQNPLSLRIVNYNNWRMSAAMESILVGFEDPRLPEYFNPIVEDAREDDRQYHGLRNGLAVEDMAGKNDTHSKMDTKWWLDSQGGSNPPIYVMNAAEVYFLRAEGALEGWNMGGAAKELYEKGIETSLTEWTDIDPQEITKYIQSSNTPVPLNDEWNTPALSDIPVAFDEGASKERQLEQIITQKWIAIFPDGWEAWAEARRTGYPKLYTRLNSDNPDVPADQIMRRLTIASGEHSNNTAAVEAALQLPELADGDRNSTRVWWDAKNN